MELNHLKYDYDKIPYCEDIEMAFKIPTNKAASSDGDKGDAKNKIAELAKGLTTGASELAKNTAGKIQSVDIKK